jgi:hypothetical protein
MATANPYEIWSGEVPCGDDFGDIEEKEFGGTEDGVDSFAFEEVGELIEVR